jgi:heterodisulfide reductase subunit A-like polyferredoxin
MMDISKGNGKRQKSFTDEEYYRSVVEKERIGVFICHCGTNISQIVDIPEVLEYSKTLPGVAVAVEYKYMCSDPGQELIRQLTDEYKLTRIVVSSCSPLMHEMTFRLATADAGLNQFMMQMANIREQVSWVHVDKKAATEKAKDLIRAAVRRVVFHKPLEVRRVPVNPNTMVVGAGISGIEAALKLAEGGHKVYLVEKDPSIGGHMAKFDKTFPTLDCAACILTPKMVSVGRNKNIEMLSLSQVEEVSGYVGNFKVRVREKARYVDLVKCTSCSQCALVCPVRNVPEEFNMNLSERTAIYRPFAQAVPNKYLIDKRGPAPCKVACPVGQEVPGYLSMIAEGKYKEAVEVIRRDNPLPSVCGWTCYHPCEKWCERDHVEKSISIRDLKRFPLEWAAKNSIEVTPPEPKERRAEKIAVVGAKPAGIAAAFQLARVGYSPTLFTPDAVKEIGLSDRVPDEMVKLDVEYLKKMGVVIADDKGITPDSLKAQGFKAIIIARGWEEEKKGTVDATKGDLGGVAFQIKDAITGETSIAGVFAVGLVPASAVMAVHPMRRGTDVAKVADAFLRGTDIAKVVEPLGDPSAMHREDYINPAWKLDYSNVLHNEREKLYEKGVVGDLRQLEASAKREAARCLSCGVCVECWECSRACGAMAINHDDKDVVRELEVGSIIITTGFKVFDAATATQFGYGQFDNVYTSLEFERICHASGPTLGRLLKKDGTEPKSIALLHCIGSRDKHFNEHCSRVCCMYSLKLAHLIKEKVHDCEVYELYIDMRCFGKGYEEFYNRLLQEGVQFIRGKAAEVSDFPSMPVHNGAKFGKGKLFVRCEDTLLGVPRELPVDMVVLSVGLEAAADQHKLQQIFKISRSADGFFLEKHPKLAPVNTASDGIFIAGCAQGPKDIPDSVAQGAAAAGAAMALIHAGEVVLEPTTAHIEVELCTGCGTCLTVCPFDSIHRNVTTRQAEINEALCKGCGTCIAACPSGAAQQWGFDDIQIVQELNALLKA